MRQTFIIKFKEDGKPDPSCLEPWNLLVEYLKRYGVFNRLEPLLPKMSRVWTEIMLTPEGPKCMGFTTLMQVWDVANFHCEDDRSRAHLIQRLATVIEESQGERTAALVNVHPDAEAEWVPMLEQMGAQRANRWLVPVGATLEKGGNDVLREKLGPEQSGQHTEKPDSKRNRKTGPST